MAPRLSQLKTASVGAWQGQYERNFKLHRGGRIANHDNRSRRRGGMAARGAGVL